MNSFLIYKSSPKFEFARKRCLTNLENLDKVEKQPYFSSVLKKSIDLVKKAETDQSVFDELQKTINSLCTLFITIYERGNAAINLNMNQQNKTKLIVEAEKESSQYITEIKNEFNKNNFNIQYQAHPMLMDSRLFRKFDKYLNLKLKNLPICPCGNHATVFGYPCHRPVGCAECWTEDDAAEKICPICGEEISEFVTLVEE